MPLQNEIVGRELWHPLNKLEMNLAVMYCLKLFCPSVDHDFFSDFVFFFRLPVSTPTVHASKHSSSYAVGGNIRDAKLASSHPKHIREDAWMDPVDASAWAGQEAAMDGLVAAPVVVDPKDRPLSTELNLVEALSPLARYLGH
ncbi:hypothetical protein Nepgr_013950 [Nepenthes gracilis]|uniref:Uncharacterized protein n=1 Tax=Nepenthes gracilis TaxID=150966 RepID=A0AAD3SJZ0_NEPGR|nr:hypothetical protein Nepgr_013950 [Nepenthes gracilis]